MKLEQVKKWAVSQLTALIRFTQPPAVLELKDFENRPSYSKLFEIGPMGVGVLGHPFLGVFYGMQEYNR
jgi:hypothetical protein